MHPIVELAKDTIYKQIAQRVACQGGGEPGPEFSGRAGVFVSIKKHGELRGCIGTISPQCASIAKEVERNAIAAATQDPRFPPVAASELDDLTFSVDVLMPAEPIGSLSELDPKRYGIIVAKGGRRGLLLPDLEGVDSPEEQFYIACMKAGISPDEDGIKLERFEVKRYK